MFVFWPRSLPAGPDGRIWAYWEFLEARTKPDGKVEYQWPRVSLTARPPAAARR